MICCLQGGMGNQMFQYAMAKAQALRLNAPLYLNTTRFNNCSLGRMYSLGLWKNINNLIRNEEYNLIKEEGLPYNQSIVDRIHPESTLVGYWQTEKYFRHIASVLREDFVIRQSLTPHGYLMQNKILGAGDRSTFLTIRRTDYLNNDFHGVLSMEYYNKALSIISQHIDPMVFVFSDDPHWCAREFKIPYEFVVAGNFDQTRKGHLGREDEELYLMRLCKHAVMANSSYSWWGAWLNHDPGITIAPKTWFLSKEEDPRDIVPQRWIRV
jgi:hypothetical protein